MTELLIKNKPITMTYGDYNNFITFTPVKIEWDGKEHYARVIDTEGKKHYVSNTDIDLETFGIKTPKAEPIKKYCAVNKNTYASYFIYAKTLDEARAQIKYNPQDWEVTEL